jgi:hypothetical protein
MLDDTSIKKKPIGPVEGSRECSNGFLAQFFQYIDASLTENILK